MRAGRLARIFRAGKVEHGLLALALLVSCAKAAAPVGPPPPPAGPPAPPSAVQWIASAAHPLHAEAAPSEESDLAPFDAAVGDARVVALGEATHGTHEFFLLKQRLVESLVLKRGFRSLVLEADGAATCDIDAFVQTGEGNPAELLHRLGFWTWNTRELLDLILWMRSYNRNHPAAEALHLQGMDMQNPQSSSLRVLAFLRRVDPAFARRAERAYGCLGNLADRAKLYEDYRTRPAGDQMQCGKNLHDVYETILANRARYDAQGHRDAACALLSSRLMEQAEVLLRSPVIRDHYYAENVLSFLAPQGDAAKLIVWAHNGHIANARGAMGRALKRELGARYLPVGLTFYTGSFRARPIRKGSDLAGPPVSIPAPRPRADSYEQAFHRTGLQSFFLDLRQVGSTPAVAAWLRGPHPLWDVGGVYGRGAPFSRSRLSEELDLLFFFDRTEGSEPLVIGRNGSTRSHPSR